MRARPGVGAGPVAVLEALISEMRVDYADAFEVRLPHPDHRSAEAWLRCGLEEAPRPVRVVIHVAHRYVLGFRLVPATEPNQVLGWHIAEAQPDRIHVTASSPTMGAELVVLRPDQHRATITTLLTYKRPGRARVVWKLVGPLHRRIALWLLKRAAMPTLEATD